MSNEIYIGLPVDETLVRNYMKRLISCFFKILPMWEDHEPTLFDYMEALRNELLGCGDLIQALNYDPMFLSILSVLQYLINTPECSSSQVRREIFYVISLCNKLKAMYGSGVVGSRKVANGGEAHECMGSV